MTPKELRNLKRLYCPVCKSTDLYLKEVWEGHYISFNYKDGKIIGKGNLEAGVLTKWKHVVIIAQKNGE